MKTVENVVPFNNSELAETAVGKKSFAQQKPSSTNRFRQSVATVGKLGAGGELELTGNSEKPISARRAYSCLLQPELGDRVLCCETSEGSCYVLAILERSAEGCGHLSLPRRQALHISASQLLLQGDDSVRVQSRRQIALACLGDIQLSAKNFISTIIHSLIQLAQHQISKADHISLTAKQLLRSHGHHQIMTADEDVKIDGERINMG